MSLYDPAIIETFIALFYLLAFATDGPRDLHQISPDIARTMVGLFIGSFSACNPRSPASYGSAHTLSFMFGVCDDRRKDKRPIVADPGSIWCALGERYEEAALAIMAALNGDIGWKAGPRMPKVSPTITSPLQILSLSMGIPTLRFALIQQGLVSSLCLAMRRAVRGEFADRKTNDAFAYVVLALLEDTMQNPQQVREALDARILSTVLRIPDTPFITEVAFFLPEGTDTDLIAKSTAFLSRLSTYVVFPTLRHAFERSFRHAETLINRGAITFPGSSGSLLAAEYNFCTKFFQQQVYVPASTHCYNRVRHLTQPQNVVLTLSGGLFVQWVNSRMPSMPRRAILFNCLPACGLDPRTQG